MRFISLIVTIAALALAVTPALAGKGGIPNGGGNAGNGSGSGGGSASYPGTLNATPSVLHAGDYFDVSGCGYDTEYGNVIIGFTGGSWGSPLDSGGCFTITGIPALSGDTLSPGTYAVTAYQYVHNDRLTKTGETTVTVVQ
jgi:hypothetical protein